MFTIGTAKTVGRDLATPISISTRVPADVRHTLPTLLTEELVRTVAFVTRRITIAVIRTATGMMPYAIATTQAHLHGPVTVVMRITPLARLMSVVLVDAILKAEIVCRLLHNAPTATIHGLSLLTQLVVPVRLGTMR